MPFRVPSFVPRVAVLTVGVLSLTAGLTYAAGSDVPSAPTPTTTTAKPVPPVVVPDVRNQPFTFAKGMLEDAGFAWQVVGSAQGYPANVVVSQSPAPGVRLVQTGAPLITLTLREVSKYHGGEPENTSPYPATGVQPVDLGVESSLGPELPAGGVTTPTVTHSTTTTATTTTATTTTTAAAPAATPKHTSAAATRYPQSRPPAFTVPGGKKEPLDEMPLTDRAQQLAAWVDAHPKNTRAAVSHWLYQHAWIVTGAELGWWHGAQALQTLVSVDGRVQQLWGIGADSRAVAEHALADVRAKAGH
jgi:PASTA domain-containing protein